MSKSHTKVVDLVQSEDGVYEPKRVRDKSVRNSKGKGLTRTPINDKPKLLRENHADEFLMGMDLGLDFIENLMPRVDRFLKLRG